LTDSIKAADSAQEDFDGGTPPRFEQCLAFENVHFDYDQHPVFKGVSLQIEFGSLITLVGPSGSGKTTIIDLAIGLVRPQRERR
jgi:ATP-binding cassette subfamily C protein